MWNVNLEIELLEHMDVEQNSSMQWTIMMLSMHVDRVPFCKERSTIPTFIAVLTTREGRIVHDSHSMFPDDGNKRSEMCVRTNNKAVGCSLNRFNLKAVSLHY